MRAKRQQGDVYQRRLFTDDAEPACPDQGGEDGIQPARHEESQPCTAADRTRALTVDLMERICERDNLNRAYRKAAETGETNLRLPPCLRRARPASVGVGGVGERMVAEGGEPSGSTRHERHLV